MVAEVEKRYGDGAVAHSGMIARNTLRWVDKGGTVRYRLHDTDVVTSAPSGHINIDTGGWNTMTTRDRINSALREIGRPVQVYTSKGAMHVRIRDASDKEFVRRVTVDNRNRVRTDVELGDEITYESLRPYVEGYLDKLKSEGIPEDGSGDPWVMCREGGKYSADMVKLWLGVPSVVEAHGDHVDGYPYVFLSLVTNAMLWSGLSQYGAGCYMAWFNQGDKSARRLVCGKVRRYLRACLGYASS